ncbi:MULTISPECIES: L-lactate dehydrogenase [unclassified Rhizobium]|uniref:L-lactate dehydrogenase n=1 Tax=unclassified Rhizobium TaxID=2613769 RepID=UPI001C82E6DE|nr:MULTISPECIES: L-lactate dehydrogenase [unclassified Rhizobium]MBX5214477.1 L-lactate dehydrogenase [Rhizobium sp. NLR9a]MBX5222272.1 L-lactate dehydrogenase [Rhizobium sp. NLR8a]MBX5227573.1 L-lactate dehydrogenase [Rhizobium sp. NLR9b]MBX5239581.1 L-lactate dehydrogenase [Rhizobium sp. NLR22b]MBX5245681.1 L-lactate dehydrogenase [Rhizobium sp. NLR3b]
MKVGIVGAGMVGSATAYALGLRGVASEVVLVDLDPALAEAQALDIAHAMPFASGTSISHGDYDHLRNAGVVVIAAGVAQRSGETRTDLLSRNAAVFRTVVGEIMRVCPDAILLVASNPVDIMTQIAEAYSGLPNHRVIGSGTILDTARFRSLLGAHLRVSPRSIHAYVLGEHGDSQVLAWSGARAGTVPIALFGAQIGAPITEAVRTDIDSKTRNAAYTIIKGKGSTYYGIGAGLARIVGAVRQDEQAVLSVSSVTALIEGVRDVALSVPRVVGREGISTELLPDLDTHERAALQRSASKLRGLFEAVTL